MEVPPTESVYQLILFPAEVALNNEVAPAHTLIGEAVIADGAAGKPTVTVTAVLGPGQLEESPRKIVASANPTVSSPDLN